MQLSLIAWIENNDQPVQMSLLDWIEGEEIAILVESKIHKLLNKGE